jgi:hypothetical protein
MNALSFYLNVVSNGNWFQLEDTCKLFSGQINAKTYGLRWNYNNLSNVNIEKLPESSLSDFKSMKSLGGSEDLVFFTTTSSGQKVFRKVFKTINTNAMKEVLLTLIFSKLLLGIRHRSGNIPFPELNGLYIGTDHIVMDTLPLKGVTATKFFCDSRSRKASWKPALTSIISLMHNINVQLRTEGYLFVHADLHANNIFLATNGDNNDIEASFIDFGWSQLLYIGKVNGWDKRWVKALNDSLPVKKFKSRHSSMATFRMDECPIGGKPSKIPSRTAIKRYIKDKVREGHVHHIDVSFFLSMAKILDVPIPEKCTELSENSGDIMSLLQMCRI